MAAFAPSPLCTLGNQETPRREKAIQARTHLPTWPPLPSAGCAVPLCPRVPSVYLAGFLLP